MHTLGLTVRISRRAEDSQKMMEDMLAKYELMKQKLDSTKERGKAFSACALTFY